VEVADALPVRGQKVIKANQVELVLLGLKVLLADCMRLIPILLMPEVVRLMQLI
jgi:hypothetical protein